MYVQLALYKRRSDYSPICGMRLDFLQKFTPSRLMSESHLESKTFSTKAPPQTEKIIFYF